MTESNAPESTAPVSPGDEPPRFSIVRGNPTDAELAAVTAVVTAMADELASSHSPVTVPQRNAWSYSQRGLRRPIAPGAGAWNRHDF